MNDQALDLRDFETIASVGLEKAILYIAKGLAKNFSSDEVEQKRYLLKLINNLHTVLLYRIGEDTEAQS